jgi:hypothetical protein
VYQVNLKKTLSEERLSQKDNTSSKNLFIWIGKRNSRWENNHSSGAGGWVETGKEPTRPAGVG